MNLIQDEKQFNKFVDFLPELKTDEVYFISLSARNKYLTEEERKKYSLGRTEMFGRCIAKSKEQLKDYTIKKLESVLSYKTTKNGSKIPEKALVTYININPSSMIKAYMLFQKEMNKQVAEVMQALQNNKEPNFSYINIQDRVLMNCIQKSSGTKTFIDIDCDTKESHVINFIQDTLNASLIHYLIIETHGGFHFLIKKDTIPTKKQKTVTKSFNLQKLCTDAQALSEQKKVEVMINGNAMVPVPGTCQANFLVRMI